jgi:hypothetical protein
MVAHELNARIERIIIMGILSSLLRLFGYGKQEGKPEVPNWANDPRKVKTETELQSLGIPINRYLPLVEAEDEARIRDPKDVAKRAAILRALAAVGHGGDRNVIQEFLKSEGLWESVTSNERILFGKDDPPEQAIIDAAWRAEALWALIWALGKVEKLELPKGQCDPEQVHRAMPDRGELAEFISSATLRSKSEILDETDSIYRIHWAVRDAQINGRPIPAGLNVSVVVERHYALNWLTWYEDEWDDVTTDP